MGSSTGRDLHVDQLLTNVAINYRPEGMIADQLAPVIPVQKETDSYPIFNRGEVFAIEKTLRARGQQANRITRSVSSSQYACKNYALAYDTPVEDRANMDAIWQFNTEAGQVQYLTDKLMLDYDRRTLLLVRNNVGTTFLAGSSWVGPTNGDAFSQIVQMQEQIKNLTAQRPNSLLFGWKAWQQFRRNTPARNLIKGTNNGGGLINKQQAMDLFEVERLLVAEAFYNPANENQTATFSTVFPADAVVAYFAPMAASIDRPSYMYSFRWVASELGSPFAAVRHEFASRERVDGVEVQYYQDEKITGSEYSAMLLGVGSAQATGLA
jgi:hypothetical protein